MTDEEALENLIDRVYAKELAKTNGKKERFDMGEAVGTVMELLTHDDVFEILNQHLGCEFLNRLDFTEEEDAAWIRGPVDEPNSLN